jgi:hypothetical protein
MGAAAVIIAVTIATRTMIAGWMFCEELRAFSMEQKGTDAPESTTPPPGAQS